MPTKLRCGTALALVCLAHLSTTPSATAVTAELARKCEVLTDKAYPLRVPGNPAAGREHGTSKEVRDYFNRCVANRGNAEEQPPKQGDPRKHPPTEAIRAIKVPKKNQVTRNNKTCPQVAISRQQD